MIGTNPRRFAHRGLALFGLLLVAVSAPAQEAKPQRKDSSDRLKPKEVVLTAKVTPESAVPGDKVTYTVTAKIDTPWHIYKYDANPPEEGPKSTNFDFFRLDGLKPTSEPSGPLSWKAAKTPIRKKEPAFPTLEAVEFYEKEASWSVELTVPADAPVGSKTLQSQIQFQICNDMLCKPPVYVTVPPVTLKIQGKPSSALPILKAPTIGLIVPFDGQPARKDTSAKLRPKEVELTASVEPAEAAPGDVVTYRIKAKINDPWHVYAYKKDQGNDDGPIATSFDFFDRGGLKPVGDWTPSKEPKAEKSEAFIGSPIVEYHDGEVIWSQKLKVPDDAKPGTAIPLKCQVHFQTCNDSLCLPPVYWSPDPPSLKIKSKSTTGAFSPAALIGPLVVGSLADEAPEAPTKSLPSAGGSTAQTKIDQGLLPFLGWSALGGLFALLMPCVWPMIPVTVNFFVKQGQSKQGSTTGLAITYCLAIIGIFTLVGLLFSAAFGASALTWFANWRWVNLIIGLVFIAFGLSLLGLFEIQLPSAWLNASAKQEGRGGLIGVFFMALTLTITSFTCTFPVVGGLIVLAADGHFLYPILGMATFATVLALPFFLLALSPGLLKAMPRSGDWMNSIKVVGGLVEIGAAFKFLNAAEVGFGTVAEDCWINASVLLAIWIVLCLVCGVYLLGLFRTDHDYDEPKVGALRIVGGVGFLALGLYLTPALFGFPPQGQIYSRLVVGLLPEDSKNLHAKNEIAAATASLVPTSSNSTGGVAGEVVVLESVRATSKEPSEAIRQEIRVHNGVAWGLSYEAALERAKKLNRPIFIDFTGVNCANCRLMEQKVLPKPEVVALLKQFIPVQLYTDFVPIASLNRLQQEELAEANSEREIDMTSEQTMPQYVIVTPDEKVVARVGGFVEAAEFQKFLSEGLESATGKQERVAQTEATAGG